MGEIPDDINREADRIFGELRYETFSDHQEDLVHDIDVIARAILVERQRCADIAGKWAGDDLQHGETRLASAYIRREILTAS